MQGLQRIPPGIHFCFNYHHILIFSFCSTLTLSLFSAKTGKVVGSVVPYEHESVAKDSYDPRTLIRGTMLPSLAVPPAYCYQRSTSGNRERLATEVDKGLLLQATHGQQ